MCARFRPKRQSVERAKKDLAKFGARKKKVLAQALGFWMDDTIGAIQQEILAVDAKDQGQLLAATTRDPVRVLPKRLKCRGHNDAEHAPVIEWGRKPRGKWPPINSLVGWAKRKGLIKTLPANVDIHTTYREQWMTAVAITKEMWISRTGGGKNKKSEAIDPVVRDLVILRLIQKKIGTLGTEGRHPFSRAIERRIPTARKEMAALVKSLS